MARYTSAACRQCRREGTKLFLKGEKCFSQKCAVGKRPTPPGQHGQARQRKMSEYGTQLREKQKTRRAYGVLETQFKRTYDRATTMKGVTGENLLQLLERRLDNVVYRSGMAASRAQARQYVNHGHFLVNDKKVDIPSYTVKSGDVLTVRSRSKDMVHFKAVREGSPRILPKWLAVNADQLTATVEALPARDDIDFSLQENMIVEFYSR
ncbi:MAG: 30S ribosomal protein S4 [Eubacteriales bacterium]|jgi:small subunit ribosomal protein S4|nr:30S ribosomal protein S4 [Eubacteriales bacterium]MDD4105431.1 30S ribosomal protein S4 [Eubacteriales bacterium]MDD4710147.1 30S ribosomal protein S4 [Eubacteriales bacterium]NLO15786.1 30S ribosomal protein S4 [Clostridiales bacterium]